jgi:hypothetical protein
MNQQKLLWTLRCLALAGVCLPTLKYLIFSSVTEPRQEYGYYLLLSIFIIVSLTFLILHKAARKLIQNPDLLVPFGIGFLSTELISLIGLQQTNLWFFKNGSFDFSFFHLKPEFILSVIFVWVLQILSGVFFVGWTTKAILQLRHCNKVDLLFALKDVPNWFWRVFAILLFFNYVPVLLLIPFILGTSFQAIVSFLIILIAVLTLALNFSTYAVLLNALSNNQSLLQSSLQGIKLSLQNSRKVAFPLLVQMLMLGWIVIISVSFTKTETKEQTNEFGVYSQELTSETRKTQFNYSTNLVWVGSYEESSKWHKSLMDAVESKPLISTEFKINLLLLFLTILLKIHIVLTIWSKNESLTLESNKGTGLILLFALAFFLFPFEIFKNALESVKPSFNPEMAKFVKPNIFSGHSFFNKTIFFQIGQHETVEFKQPWHDDTVFQVGNIESITVSENKESIVLSGRENAIIFDKNGNLQERVFYKLGKTEDKNYPEARFDSVKAVDIEEDGKYEFVGVGSYPRNGFILNQKGEIIWRYTNVKDVTTLRNIEVKDVDADGQKEIVIDEIGEMKFLDLQGNEKWSQESSTETFCGDSFLVDIENDGMFEIVSKSCNGGNVRELKDKGVLKIKKPVEQHGFLIEKDEKPHILFMSQNKLGLFDFDGNLKTLFPAPLSYIEDKRTFRQPDALGFDGNYVDIYEIKAAKVKLKSETQKYLVVLATLRAKIDELFVDMLYVYDSQGNLVYQESFEKSNNLLQIIPNSDGTEDFFVVEDKTVWRYRAN